MGLQKMAVGEKSEDPQNISAGPSDRRSENDNGPAPSIATGVGTSINTSFSFSGTGDFANSSTAESETSNKSDDKGTELVNAKLVSASNESAETSANTSTNVTQEVSNDANETSQTSEINQTSASALDISYGQEGEAGHCVSFSLRVGLQQGIPGLSLQNAHARSLQSGQSEQIALPTDVTNVPTITGRDQVVSSRPKTEEEEMEDIQQLLGMGFDEEKVLAAYYEANRDVRMAAHKLVELSFGPSA